MIRGACAALTSRGNFRLLALQAPPPPLDTPPSLQAPPPSPPASPCGWAGPGRASRAEEDPLSPALGLAGAS